VAERRAALQLDQRSVPGVALTEATGPETNEQGEPAGGEISEQMCMF
jgi:hypothetical protein